MVLCLTKSVSSPHASHYRALPSMRVVKHVCQSNIGVLVRRHEIADGGPDHGVLEEEKAPSITKSQANVTEQCDPKSQSI